jgi:hypothetical protein
MDGRSDEGSARLYGSFGKNSKTRTEGSVSDETLDIIVEHLRYDFTAISVMEAWLRTSDPSDSDIMDNWPLGMGHHIQKKMIK